MLIGVICSAISGILYAYSIKLLNELITLDGVNYGLFSELFVLVGISTVLSVFAGFYLTRLYEERVSELRVDLSDKVLKTSFETVELHSSKIIPILHYDINYIGSFAKSIPEMIVALFKVLFICAYMFIISWQLTISVLIVFGVVFIITLLVLPKLHREERKIQHFRNMLYKHLSGLVNGIKELTLNLSHQVGYVNQTVAPTSSALASRMSVANSINIFVTKTAELVVIVGIGVIVILMKSTTNFSAEVFLDFLTLVLFVLPSLIVVTTFTRALKKVDAALEQIEEIGVTFEYSTQSSKTIDADLKFEKSRPVISFQETSYWYNRSNGEGYEVGPINLNINNNEVIILRGGNGSGKTTMAKMLAGLYNPKSGKILWKGAEVSGQNLHLFRDQFSAVFTDSHVFQDLRYLAGDDQFSVENLEKIAKMLDIGGKIHFDDLVISDVDLSFGQRGRLNLLRALLEDKPIYLFDEWAANQDPYFKEKFYMEIIPELKAAGKTVIIISHDEKYYEIGDRIVTLSAGKVKSDVPIDHQSTNV